MELLRKPLKKTPAEKPTVLSKITSFIVTILSFFKPLTIQEEEEEREYWEWKRKRGEWL